MKHITADEIEAIAKALVNQYAFFWKTLQAAVKKIPNERWQLGQLIRFLRE